MAAFVTTEEIKDKQGSTTPDLPTLTKPKKDLTKVKCFRCKKKGHMVNKCPQKEAECKAAEANVHLVWREANIMTTHGLSNVMNAMDEMLKVSPDEVLLDTPANISLFHPLVLQEVQESKTMIQVKGIGGYQITLTWFFRCVLS